MKRESVITVLITLVGVTSFALIFYFANASMAPSKITDKTNIIVPPKVFTMTPASTEATLDEMNLQHYKQYAERHIVQMINCGVVDASQTFVDQSKNHRGLGWEYIVGGKIKIKMPDFAGKICTKDFDWVIVYKVIASDPWGPSAVYMRGLKNIEYITKKVVNTRTGEIFNVCGAIVTTYDWNTKQMISNKIWDSV